MFHSYWLGESKKSIIQILIMKKLNILLMFSLLLLCFVGNAQNKVKVSGVVVDSLNAPLSGATVVLLQQSDSVLVSFAISNGKGQFDIPMVATFNLKFNAALA